MVTKTLTQYAALNIHFHKLCIKLHVKTMQRANLWYYKIQHSSKESTRIHTDERQQRPPACRHRMKRKPGALLSVKVMCLQHRQM